MRVLRTVLRPFWNRDERRLRAPWRIVLGAVFYVAVSFGLGVLLSQVGASGWLTGQAGGVQRVVGVTLNGALVLLSVGVAALLLDRRRTADYGLDLDRDWWLDLGFGLALGGGLMTLVFAVEYALGWVVVVDTFVSPSALAFPAEFALILVAFLWVGLYEELMTRGFLLTNLAEGLRLEWPVVVGRLPAVALATLLSSALFGLLHAANPNATLVSSVAIGVAGVMLALGYVLTGELAIPVGLHVTWNLFQGAVYGFPVSGIQFGVSVLGVDQRGPAVVTGGQFGPEAGLVGIGAMVLGSALTVAYVRYRYDEVAIAPVDLPALRWQ